MNIFNAWIGKPSLKPHLPGHPNPHPRLFQLDSPGCGQVVPVVFVQEVVNADHDVVAGLGGLKPVSCPEVEDGPGITGFTAWRHPVLGCGPLGFNAGPEPFVRIVPEADEAVYGRDGRQVFVRRGVFCRKRRPGCRRATHWDGRTIPGPAPRP